MQLLPRNREWEVTHVVDNGVDKYQIASAVYRIGFVVDDLARAELLFSSLTMMTEDGHDLLVVLK